MRDLEQFIASYELGSKCPCQSLDGKEEPDTSCDYPLWTAVQDLQLIPLPLSFLPAWMGQIFLG